FHLGDEGGEIAFTLGVGLIHLFLHARLVQGLLGLVGQAFAVGGLVVEDRDVLVGEGLGEVSARHRALLIVASANPEGVPKPSLGEGRIGGSRRNLQDAAFGIGFRGRN